MKLCMSRMFGGERMCSITHFGSGDKLADEIAVAIRKELKTRARVVEDRYSGCRHIFVPDEVYCAAITIAVRMGG